MQNSAQNGPALLEPADLAEVAHREADPISLDLIDPSPNNPRQKLPDVDALADSIKDFTTPTQIGLMQPITVRRVGDRYEIIGGHRRWAAFLALQEREPLEPRWKAIPAVVRTFDDTAAYIALVSSQVQTRSWKPKEEAAALERLALAGMTLKQIGERLHRSEAWASKRLAVYADPVLSAYVQSGKLAATSAEELLIIPEAPTKRGLAEQAIAEGWPQDRIRAEVQKLRASRSVRQVSKRSRELHDLLSSVPSSEIPRADAEELLRLAKLIMRMAKQAGPVIPRMEQARAVEPRRSSRQKTHVRRLSIPRAPAD